MLIDLVIGNNLVPDPPANIMQTVLSIVQKYILNDKFFKNNVVVFILTNLGNLCQFIFQIICIRLFVPEDFAIFGSINAYIALVSAPVVVIPLLVSKYLIKSDDKHKSINFLINLIIKFSIISIIICLLLHPFIKSILNIEKNIYFIVSYIALILSAIISVCFGILQGLKKYIQFGIFHFFSLFSKLIFLLVASFFYQEIILLFIANASGILFSILLFIILYRKLIFSNFKLSLKNKHLDDNKIFFNNSYNFFLTSIVILFFTNIDQFLSKVLLDSKDAGIYIAASSFSKIPFFLTMNLAYVLFPEINIENSKNSNFSKVLTVLAFISLVSISFIILLNFYGSYIIEILYGDLYLEARRYIIILVASMMFVNLNYVILISLLVRKSSYQFIVFAIVSLIFMILILLLNINPLIFAYVFMSYNIIIFLLLISRFIILNLVSSSKI